MPFFMVNVPVISSIMKYKATKDVKMPDLVPTTKLLGGGRG